MSTPSILAVFSEEILELILKESKTHSPAEYSSLRLVCKAINDLVEPHVFSTLIIQFTQGNKDSVGEKLSALISGSSPYTRWAKTLQFGQLVPLNPHRDYGFQYDPFQGQEREEVLEKQSRLLVPAIRAMAEVEAAIFSCSSTRDPINDVLGALTGLPLLQELTLYRIDMDADLLNKFSNLRSLKIRYPSAETWQALKSVISKSPSLSTLELLEAYGRGNGGSERENANVDLGSLIKDAMESPTFAPTLSSLSVSRDAIRLSDSCVPFLRSLAHLRLGEGAIVLPSFWTALEATGAHLQTLHVPQLDQHSVKYVLSYSGLNDLKVGWPTKCLGDPAVEDEITHQFFHNVLPKHCATLRSLSYERGGVGPWCATDSNMKGIASCKALQVLDMLYYFPSPNEKVVMPIIPLGRLLSRFSDSLPSLETVRVTPVRKFQTGFGCGFAWGEYFRAVHQSFAMSIARAQVSADQKPRFLLTAVGIEFSPVEGKVDGRYQFKMDECPWREEGEAGEGEGEEAAVYDPDAWDSEENDI
ncbi:hypothetical protein D9611_001238 [Ephemerocybe angulata]|uniref:F-box domain-containing protein n=1 Tax=Ephemerocybe angulata TaxID=980116 RepID=A0A8H5FLV4_9AGAR|nr:hypothetical protein D9611_001238 [Tulosesus angulatus]